MPSSSLRSPYTPPHSRKEHQTTATTPNTNTRADLQSIFHPDSPPSPPPTHPRLSTSTSTSSNGRNSRTNNTALPPSSTMTATSTTPASIPSHPSIFFSTPSSKAKAQSASAQIKNETNFNTFRMTPPPSASSRRRQQQVSSALSTASSTRAPSAPPSFLPVGSSPQDVNDGLELEGERVLQTPRRGRRLGGVQMGWETPHTNDDEEPSIGSTVPESSACSSTPVSASISSSSVATTSTSLTAPATVPRTRSSATTFDDLHTSGLISVTPRKRRSPVDGSNEIAASSPTKRSNSGDGETGPSLRDEEGYATAVYASSFSPSKADHSVDGSSEVFEAPPRAAARFDRLAAFRCDVPASSSSSTLSNTFFRHEQHSDDRNPSCNLVAVEVKGMGRVAVAREVAVQLGGLSEEELKASQADVGSSDDFIATAGSGYGAFSSYSCGSSNHPLASLDTTASGGYLGPSPSFSLASHFPISEDGSPSLRARPLLHPKTRLDANTLTRVIAFKEKLLEPAPSSQLPFTSQANLGDPAAHSLVMNTPIPFSSDLPTLAWPDASTGPWSGSTGLIEKQSEARLKIVSRWLDGDDDIREGADGWLADDETAEPRHPHSSCLRGRTQFHPMIAQVIRNRNRKSTTLIASSASMPNLTSCAHTDSKRRGRKPKECIKSRRGRPRNELKTPTKRHVFSSSSLSRSVINSGGESAGSFDGCFCGNSHEDSPMVQCDGCQIWYHMRCAGIRRPDELDETWFCQPCLVDPTSSQTRRKMNISPASTIALANLHASGGSYTTSTPGLLGSDSQRGLTAFPRAYATHIGVSTPSAAYPRIKPELFDRLPVFAHEESPADFAAGRIGTAFASSSGSLALAPSPEMDAGDGSAMIRRQHVRGRSRASRIGWRTAEPGSPLDRKSASALAGFTVTTPAHSGRSLAGDETSAHSYGVKQQTSNARGLGDSEEEQLSGSRTMSPSFFSSMRGRGLSARMRDVPDRTPSPTRPPVSATPSRHARRDRGDSDLDPDHAEHRDSEDALSTPSRHWWTSKNNPTGAFGQGSSTASNGLVPLGLQTPSRSARRRESSGWALSFANFSTPGSARDREMLFGQQSGTDISGGYSSGMPSLIYSSGSIVGGGRLDGTGSEESPGAYWLNSGLSSPSNSLRRRQRSHLGNAAGGNSSEMIRDDATHHGSVLNTQGELNSVRTSIVSTPSGSTRRRRLPSSGPRTGGLNDSSDCYDDHTHGPMDRPTSSSPYPRTPSFDLGYSSANRLNTRRSGGASTPNSPTPSRGKMTLGPFGAGGGNNNQARGNFKKSMSVNAAHGGGLSFAETVGNKIGRRPVSGEPPALARGRQASDQPFDSSGSSGVGLGLDLEDVLQFY